MIINFFLSFIFVWDDGKSAEKWVVMSCSIGIKRLNDSLYIAVIIYMICGDGGCCGDGQKAHFFCDQAKCIYLLLNPLLKSPPLRHIVMYSPIDSLFC